MDVFRTGLKGGLGAAINVELGWIPDRVEVYNATDGTILTVGFPNEWVIPFSSGGVIATAAGDLIKGATTLARAIVKEVIITSGTFAGGDAAGFFTVTRDGLLSGTFGSENIINLTQNAAGTDDATITVNVTHSYKVDTAAAAVTGNSAIAPYAGVGSTNSKGFTIGSSVATAAKALRWSAWRNPE